MEKQMQQLSLDDTSRSESKMDQHETPCDENKKDKNDTSHDESKKNQKDISHDGITKNQNDNQNTSRSRCKNQKSSMPKSKSMFQETKKLLDKRTNELELYYRKLSKRRNVLSAKDGMEDECAKIDCKMSDLTNQLIVLRELSKVHQSDVKKFKRVKNKRRKQNKKNFTKLMEDFQHYKELLSLLRKAEVREAFRTGTSGAVELSKNELEYLYWLNDEMNPAINSVDNKTVWQKKLRESTSKAMEILTGSNKQITSSWTGQNTKHLLERISKCAFFKGRTIWVNMEMFTRINNASVFRPHSYYYDYNRDTQITPDEDIDYYPKMTFYDNEKKSKCNVQSSNDDCATHSNVQQCNAQAENKASDTTANTKENYKFIKRSDKPDDYYLCFNYYPTRFTADVKVPPALARRPPPGLFRCDI